MGEREQGTALSISDARIYDALLGGKNSYPPDRRAAKRLARANPDLVGNARANRRFLARVVGRLAGPGRIAQYLDIGAGLPWADNTHEVAQRARSASRVVYVDNDPAVLAHARATLTSTPDGRIAFVRADLRDPQAVIAAAAGCLDYSAPIAIMLLDVLDVMPPDDAAYAAVKQLIAAAAPGSYLAISHPASDIHAAQAAKGAGAYARVTGRRHYNRTRDEVARFFDGLELLQPGVVQLGQWRSDDHNGQAVSAWGAVGRN